MTCRSSSHLALALTLAVVSSAPAQDVEVVVDGARATATRGSDEATGELTAGEQHVLSVADERQRPQIEKLAGHRLLGLALEVSGRLERGRYVAHLEDGTLTYSLAGLVRFGPARDALEDMVGQEVTLSGLATLSEEEVPPLGTQLGEVYRSEPVYTQWPARRAAELQLSELLGPEETRSGRIEDGRLVGGSGSIQIVGATARWLRSDHDGARVTVRGQLLNVKPQPVFVVSHVQAGAKKLGVKVKSASPLGGFGSRLFSKAPRWFTRRTYGENASVVAPAGSLLLPSKGFVKATDLTLTEPPASATSGLTQGLGGDQ